MCEYIFQCIYNMFTSHVWELCTLCNFGQTQFISFKISHQLKLGIKYLVAHKKEI